MKMGLVQGIRDRLLVDELGEAFGRSLPGLQRCRAEESAAPSAASALSPRNRAKVERTWMRTGGLGAALGHAFSASIICRARVACWCGTSDAKASRSGT